MAAHMLGFVGLDDQGQDKGYFGLEGYYERELRGKTGVLQIEKDAKGDAILIGEDLRIEPEHGRSLVLWMDRTVQRIVEKRLLEGIEKYGAKGGSVTMMDPKTGAIIGMESFPSFDPAKYWEYNDSLFKNPIITDTFEPGSIFKVLVMAAAINEGAVSPETICDICDGPSALAVR